MEPWRVPRTCEVTRRKRFTRASVAFECVTHRGHVFSQRRSGGQAHSALQPGPGFRSIG